MCQERGLVVAAAARQQCSVLSRLGAAHVPRPRPSHSEAHPHPRVHSRTHPGVPPRHMPWHTGAFPCTQFPPPASVHISHPPTTCSGPRCQPPHTPVLHGTGILPWGALAGCRGHKAATLGTLRTPGQPRPAPPGQDHRALKPAAA